MIEQSTFEQRYIARRYDTFVRPFLRPLLNFTLPFHSVIQYLPNNTVETGPSEDDVIFSPADGQKFIEHNITKGTDEGNPIFQQVQPTQLIQVYKKRHPGFRPLVNMASILRDKKTLLIENYAMIQHLWRYKPSYLAPYYQWKSERLAMWRRVAELYKVAPQRNQFVFFGVPENIPTYSEMTIAETRLNRDIMSRLGSKAGLDFIDLYKWIGTERAESVLSVVPNEALERVYIVFIENGHYVIVNLGKLNDWTKREDKENTKAAIKDPVQMKRSLLAFMVGVMAARFTNSEGAIVEGSVDQALVSLGLELSELELLPAAPELPALDFSSMVVGKPTPVADVNVGTRLLEPTNAPVKTKIKLLTEDSSVKDISRAFWNVNSPNLGTLDLLNEVSEEPSKPELSEVGNDPADNLAAYRNGVIEAATRAFEGGRISMADLRRFDRLSTKFHSIEIGNSGVMLSDLAITPLDVVNNLEAKTIPDIPGVIDKGMLKSTLSRFDSDYTSKVMASDLANFVLSVQKAGVAVTGFDFNKVEDVSNDYTDYTLTLTPVQGERSVVRFRLPNINEDGNYVINGTKYYMKKQRVDLPIRKVAPNKVALTSYYGKAFVWRDEKKVNDYGAWVRRNIESSQGEGDGKINHLHAGIGILNIDKAPYIYQIIARDYTSFNYGNYEFTFLFKDIDATFPETKTPRRKGLPCGWVTLDGERVILGVNYDNQFYRDDTGEILGTIETLLDLDANKAPVDIAQLMVFNKLVPIAFALGARIGIDKLLDTLGVKPTRFPLGERAVVPASSFSIRFADQTLVFARKDRLASIIMGGFIQYDTEVSKYAYDDFNLRDVYLNILENRAIGPKYLREVDTMFDLFVDHITREMLIDMEEPTEFGPLLIRAAQLLLDDRTPDETDMNYMRLRGYERMVGAVYTELVKGIRGQRARGANAKAPIDVNPNDVWRAIQADGSAQQVEEAVPVHNLKEQEAVTYGGTGGRGIRSMVRGSRVYHPNDMGVISEATVDSGAVAVNTSMSANPKLKTLRGITSRYKIGKDSPASLLSTSAMLSPASDMDDPKRINFISIQNSSGIGAVGYEISPVCTGYDSVMAHRVSNLFAHTAKGDGVISEIKDDYIALEYDQPELGIDRIQLGRRYGNVAGLTLPHTVTTDVVEGQRIPEGMVVCWNVMFFVRDPLNPTQVIYTPGVLANTLFIENVDGLEDSSCISQRISKALTTYITYPRVVMVNFDQGVHNLVNEGDTVLSRSILCNIEEPITANNGMFDEDSYETLRILGGRQSPLAEHNGSVDSIEVIYKGDVADMSPSLAEIVTEYDRKRSRLAKRLQRGAKTGKAVTDARFRGHKVEQNQVAIIVYITVPVTAEVGDKGVFMHQLKTTFGRKLSGINRTLNGEDIDSTFGYQSVSNRIVNSPEVVGPANACLIRIGLNAADIFFGDAN